MKLAEATLRRRSEAGFTMAEIAIALGVIAFALIAIIGILPSGLQVQRDNREETIINQDARMLLQALRSGGRDSGTDLGAFVQQVDGTTYGNGIPTATLLRLLSDPTNSHRIVFTAISGGLASRGTDLGFRYLVVNNVVSPLETTLFGSASDFNGNGTRLTNQVYDVRLRFSWPVTPKGELGAEPNRYVVRTMVSGWHRDGFLYAQEFVNPTNAIP